MARTARRSEKAKKPVRPLADERVLAVIAQIEERRARLKMSIPTMCDKAGISPATWHSWKAEGGATSPDYTDLDDCARAVGFRLGPVLDPSGQSPGGPPMPTDEAQIIALLVDRMEKPERVKFLNEVVRPYVQQRVSGNRPPPGPSQRSS
jgi:hypothetical protein